MQLFAFCAVLMSTAISSFQPSWQKWLLDNHRFHELELVAVRCILVGLCSAALCAAFFPYWEGLNAAHANATIFWLALAVTTLVNIGIQYLDIRAIGVIDISFTRPISGLTPGLVTVSVMFLGERPSLWGWTGIVLIGIGAYVTAREGAPLREYFMPLYVWRAFGSLEGLPEYEQKKRRALRYCYGSACLATVGLICDGLLARYGNPTLGLAIEWEILGFVFLAFTLSGFGKRREGVKGSLIGRLQRDWAHALGMGVTAGLSPVLLAFGYIAAPIAYIGAMKRFGQVFGAVLVAFFLFGELRHDSAKRTRRLLLGGIVALGTIVLASDRSQTAIVAHASGLLEKYFGH